MSSQRRTYIAPDSVHLPFADRGRLLASAEVRGLIAAGCSSRLHWAVVSHWGRARGHGRARAPRMNVIWRGRSAEEAPSKGSGKRHGNMASLAEFFIQHTFADLEMRKNTPRSRPLTYLRQQRAREDGSATRGGKWAAGLWAGRPRRSPVWQLVKLSRWLLGFVRIQ